MPTSNYHLVLVVAHVVPKMIILEVLSLVISYSACLRRRRLLSLDRDREDRWLRLPTPMYLSFNLPLFPTRLMDSPKESNLYMS